MQHNSKTGQGFCKLSYALMSCCKGEKVHPVIFLATSCLYYLLCRKEDFDDSQNLLDPQGLRARSCHKVKNCIDLLFTYREYTRHFWGTEQVLSLEVDGFSSVRFELTKTCSLLLSVIWIHISAVFQGKIFVLNHPTAHPTKPIYGLYLNFISLLLEKLLEWKVLSKESSKCKLPPQCSPHAAWSLFLYSWKLKVKFSFHHPVCYVFYLTPWEMLFSLVLALKLSSAC